MPDRNELIASLKGRIWGGEIHKGGYIHVPQEEAEAILELLKDSEPVVRCKDCKFWQSRVCRTLYDKEFRLCEMVRGYKPADWFCANGERR